MREIFYEYSASAVPPDPTVNSPKYVAPLAYANGYYKAIAKEGNDWSTVTSKSFGMEWTPANISTALWLDANDSATITKDGSSLVSQWNDKSGNGRNAVATNYPTIINSKMVFSLNNYLYGSMVANTLSAGFGCFIVFKKTGTVNTYEAHAFNKTLPSLASPIDYWRDQTYVGNGSVFKKYLLTDIAGCTDYTILSTTVGINFISQYKNGIFVGSDNSSVNSYADNANQYFIATRADLVTKFTGEICEVVVTPNTISDRQKIEGYLAWKWDAINGNTALVTALPSDHPYKSQTPTA
jgi:hypothetical protein